MSNLTFFKKYITKEENNIYGLTGTLGSKKAQEALKILYNLELLFIPSFKESKLKTYKEIIINNKKEYENTLFETLKFLTINKKRSVLVIFKYINEVNEVYNYLIKKGISKDILIKYSRNDITNQTNFLNEEIKPGVIILSTNLSGRGTDIKISKELEKNKGLHVILTFMPKSERIERQAFGRAGRKGEQGSGQYIIMSSEKFSQLIKERNQSEENEYKYLINSYQKKIDLFQEIFEDFSDLLNSIKKNKTNKYILLDIKERWGLFLVENDLNNIEKEYKDENSLKLDETFLEINLSFFDKNLLNIYIRFLLFCFFHLLILRIFH
jgi:preprotein translocase subunit SecA